MCLGCSMPNAEQLLWNWEWNRPFSVKRAIQPALIHFEFKKYLPLTPLCMDNFLGFNQLIPILAMLSSRINFNVRKQLNSTSRIAEISNVQVAAARVVTVAAMTTHHMTGDVNKLCLFRSKIATISGSRDYSRRAEILLTVNCPMQFVVSMVLPVCGYELAFLSSRQNFSVTVSEKT